MSKKFTKPISILLSILMVVSLLTVVPFTAGAASATGRSGSFGELNWAIDADGKLTFSGSGAIPDSCTEFSGKSDITEIVINSSVKSIGDSAFNGIKSLKKVTFTANPESLGIGIFESCTGIEFCTLPEGMTSIPESMFRFAGSDRCYLDIPDTVTSIGKYALSGRFHSVAIPADTIPTDMNSLNYNGAYGWFSYTGVTGLNTLVFKGNTYVFKQDEFDYLSYDQTVMIPSGCKCGDPEKKRFAIKDGVNGVDRETAEMNFEAALYDFNRNINKNGYSVQEALESVNSQYGDYYDYVTDPAYEYEITAANASAVFGEGNVIFDPCRITWKDEDGSVINTTYVEKDDVPSHYVPENKEDADNIYSFTAWTPDVDSATADAEYTAVYATHAKPEPAGDTIKLRLNSDNANVTWDDQSDCLPEWRFEAASSDYEVTLYTGFSSISTDNALFDAPGIYHLSDLAQEDCSIKLLSGANAGKTVYFTDGYCKVAVDGNTVTITGTFIGDDGNTYNLRLSNGRDPIIHTITWKLDENTVIDTTEVEDGEAPTHADPTKAEDDDYTYTFTGWTPEVVAATADATYTATFTQAPKHVPQPVYNPHDNNSLVYYYCDHCGKAYSDPDGADEHCVATFGFTADVEWKGRPSEVSGYIMTSYNGDPSVKTVVVPETYKGERVFAIGNDDNEYNWRKSPFYNNDIVESLVIGENVIKLCRYMVYDSTKLKTIYIDGEIKLHQGYGVYKRGRVDIYISNPKSQLERSIFKNVYLDNIYLDANIIDPPLDAYIHAPHEGTQGNLLRRPDSSNHGKTTFVGSDAHTFTDDSNVSWTWNEDYTSATAHIKCDRCEYTEDVVDSDIEKAVSGATKTYTASVEYEGHTYTTSADVEKIVEIGEDGYYRERGEIVPNKGLVKIDDDFYYVIYNGKIKRDGDRTVTEEKANGLIPAGDYHFSADGKMTNPPVKDGIDSNGYYRENYQVVKDKGLVQVDGDFYFVIYNGKVKKDGDRTVTEEKANELLPAGTYHFGTDGKMTDSPVKDGVDSNGYYRENYLVVKDKGLVQVDGDYYFVIYNGKVKKDGDRTVTEEKANGLLPAGTYHFGTDGKMTNPPVKDGVDSDGYYRENYQVVKDKGLVQVDGDYYYVIYNGKVKKNGDRTVTEAKANGLLPAGTYHFGADGKLVFPE